MMFDLACYVSPSIERHCGSRMDARNQLELWKASVRKEQQNKNIDTSRTRTDASEESRFLIYRLRPLGHSVLLAESCA